MSWGPIKLSISRSISIFLWLAIVELLASEERNRERERQRLGQQADISRTQGRLLPIRYYRIFDSAWNNLIRYHCLGLYMSSSSTEMWSGGCRQMYINHPCRQAIYTHPIEALFDVDEQDLQTKLNLSLCRDWFDNVNWFQVPN
ncbi:hypothetical protein BDV96DRAFT_32136 [Lophiotrema nucula]|uniref:Uncharacterized protein n=1 Tax=Lophiotrema nucula TaxID=690887 RepID=A0A6A5ZDY8_9PLEO|nr:hypothetical protein BDV96DRAFT_32136 [Lophiotrema nucula]